MKSTPLQLRYSPDPVRGTCAWLIPGDDPLAWLEEVSAWRVAHAKLRFYPLPRSRTNRACNGVLVTAAEQILDAGGRCLPYGTAAGRIYLPVEACLQPQVSDDELSLLLSKDFTYVWGPQTGLIAFEPGDIKTCADLLTCPGAGARQWNYADPGVVLASQLVSLAPAFVPSVDQVMQQGRGDIGDNRDSLDQLPPSPGEPPPGIVNEAMRRGARMFAASILALVNKLPHGEHRTVWNNIEDWAQQKLNTLNDGWNVARNREISRLLNMLDIDPDLGLKHALPMAGGAHRGIAAPSNRLGQRDVDFNLGGLGGGAAADYWDVPYEYQQRLITRYHELANRELNIGRYRRAAYIFAHLLGDYRSAASALTAGKHWREAAVVYSEKLNSVADAARCLENGGLWIEGIEQYKTLREFEKVGDLYAKLEQPESAHDHYNMAAADHLQRGDRIGAARILEHKLNDIDLAIDALLTDWPHSRQNKECLMRYFGILGERGRHHDACHQLAGFALPDAGYSQQQNRELVEVISHVAVHYPDRNVKSLALDCTQRLVAAQLPRASAAQARSLLACIAKLAPQDRLLQRDCVRYPAQITLPPQSRRKIRSKPRSIRLTHTLDFLRSNVDWQTAKPLNGSVFLAGVCGSDVVVARFDGETPTKADYSIFSNAAAGESGIILEPDLHSGNEVLLHVIGTENIRKTEIQTTPAGNVKIGPGAGLSPAVIAFCLQQDTKWIIELHEDFNYVLRTHAVDGAVRKVCELPFFPSSLPVPLAVRDCSFFIGAGSEIWQASESGELTSIECDADVFNVVASARGTRLRIAVSTSKGGLLFCPDAFENRERQKFATSMQNPVIGFTRGGYLVAAGNDAVEVYSTQNGRLNFHNSSPMKYGSAVAVIALPNARQFGVLFATGKMAFYEIS